VRWTGDLTSAMEGILRHGDDEIRLIAEHSPCGAIKIQGRIPERHWAGHISADRTVWQLSCKFGFRLRGTVKWDGKAFMLTQTHHFTPEDFRLPNEEAEKEVAA
jgi:hypothetical protein